MINRKVLYYPTILVPSRWLKWGIFYWDTVSSIVPYGWDRNPILIGPRSRKSFNDMKYLREEMEFEPTRPDRLIRRRQAVQNLKNEFFDIVRSSEFESSINKNWRENSRGRIHRDKLSNEIIEFLRRRGLADIQRGDSKWFLVEEKTSLLYMALLAKHLADMDIHFTVPSTDRDEYEDAIYISNDKNHGFPSLSLKFQSILPVPRDDVSMKDILRFKRKRKDELLALREVIDEFEGEASNAENETEIKRIAVQYKERIERGRSNLEKSMKESGIKRVFESFRSLISVKSPALLETIGFSLVGIPLEVSVPITVGTASIQVGYSWIDKRNKQRVELRKSPFSYLLYAKESHLIKEN